MPAYHRATSVIHHRSWRGCSSAPPVQRRVLLGAGDHGEHVGVVVVAGDLAAGEISLAGAPPLLWSR